MVDVAGRVEGAGPVAGSGNHDGSKISARALSPSTVHAIVLMIAGAIGLAFWRYEGVYQNVIFTAATTLTLGALIVAATRRLLLAAIAVGALVALVNFVASGKRETLGMVLHAYDIVFYLGSWSTVSFLWESARSYVIGFAVLMAVASVVGILAWRLDGTRLRRAPALKVALLAAVVAGVFGTLKPERRHTQFYWDALYVSSFYSSWAETVETLFRGQLIEAAEAASGPPFTLDQSCAPTARAPHIILIHQESIVQPSLFNRLDYDRKLDPFFQSSDGRTHKLRVETYGGASWLTEFSILTGLSTHAFGGMRPFVQSLLAGKVRETLPETLQNCGYRNVLFYPMLRNFVSNGRFYEAIGLREIFDLKAQGATTVSERDRFYYRNALDEMERHIGASSKPLFTYIQTMAAHWPYDYKWAPDMDVPGGGPGTDPEMHEYLRRVAIAKIDYDWLKSEIKRRFPNEPVLIVHYGDHHPMATRKLLGFSESTEAEDVVMDENSIGYITYFVVEAFNHEPPPLPSAEAIDVPYLGALILKQAGLPLSAPNRERLRLLDRCGGRYNSCSHRAEILGFHRRLIDSRLIDER
ncbi:MAG TPA: sulfatase-like hydrolase/transferase [Hyphomicrobiaceae bacterium]|nr:sulfatase-like hydrolase/transferase [Hyphomicrobiaceae bacterium]